MAISRFLCPVRHWCLFGWVQFLLDQDFDHLCGPLDWLRMLPLSWLPHWAYWCDCMSLSILVYLCRLRTLSPRPILFMKLKDCSFGLFLFITKQYKTLTLSKMFNHDNSQYDSGRFEQPSCSLLLTCWSGIGSGSWQSPHSVGWCYQSWGFLSLVLSLFGIENILSYSSSNTNRFFLCRISSGFSWSFNI